MSNMYDWIDKTLNPLCGKCLYECKYCYVKDMKKKFSVIYKKYSGDIRLSNDFFRKSLGKNKTYFIGSMIDMFAENIPDKFIDKVINYCDQYNNTYLFQSKNPERFNGFYFPDNTILGTTIETDIYYSISKAPDVIERARKLSRVHNHNTMVTIEPILEFNLKTMVDLIKIAMPDFVNIGADSKGHGLPEPSIEKVMALIKELNKFTEVREKRNLNRLINN